MDFIFGSYWMADGIEPVRTFPRPPRMCSKAKEKHRGRTPIGKVVFLLTICLAWASCTSANRDENPVCNRTELPPSRLFLQQVSFDSAIIKWRGEADVACIGVDVERLNISVAAEFIGGHKLVKLTGLEPDTVYYYSIGGAPTGGTGQEFRTAPLPGKLPGDGNTHIWLLGDSGTATEISEGHSSHPGEAVEVMNGFLKYNQEQAKNEPLDLVLLLGDNAYLEGTDEQWQGAYFDIYADIIKSTATWPTIGNHEMGVGPLFNICQYRKIPDCKTGPVMRYLGGTSESADPDSYDRDGDGPEPNGLPYLDIFTLPSKGELGGVPSGTEQYYAFNYGNVHIVSLDSQLSNRDEVQRTTMRDWLIDDLSSNTLDWTVVIFHHPPYSKGVNHDSDVEKSEIDMREAFVRVFEEYGVDVIYSGHAHSYERSWYLHGLYGDSSTFDAKKHTELNNQAQPSLGQGEDTYTQLSRASGVDDKVIYTVAGSAGKADKEKPCPEGQTMGCSLPNWLKHPAHRSFPATESGYRSNGIALKGSVVLDASRTVLTSRFVDEHGQVLDYFSITRDKP